MLRQEFEQHTHFFPSAEEYAEIEKAYTAFGGDKDAFCKAYLKNTDGLAEGIQRRIDMGRFIAQEKAEKEKRDLEARIQQLEKALDRELEWEDYEFSENVKQADYDKLAKDESTKELDDGSAKAFIASEFGFDASKIVIVRGGPLYQTNRHNRIRHVGTTDRRPLYNATDWNYLRFNCAGMSWEVSDGEIHPYIC